MRVYQNELVRTAYLLTGTPEGAVLLARDGFLSYFRELVRGDTPDDPRLGLLQQVSRAFLVDSCPEGAQRVEDNGDGPRQLLDATVALGAAQQRYRVEDDRSRVVGLLDLLDRETRLGLVLRDFNALDEEPVCQILDEIPFTLRQRLHPTRARIRDAAGVPSGTGPDHSTRELLVNAATAAPRPDLWPEVVGPLEEFFDEEDERRQRLTYAAAVGVAVLLLFAGLWIFDLLPFVSGDDDTAAVAPTAGPTATPTATPEPTVTPTPIPELSSFAIPQGDVPDRLFMLVNGDGTSTQQSAFGYFDVASGTFTEYRLDGFGTPSPDGRKLIGAAVDLAPDGSETSALIALDSTSTDLLWQSETPRTIYDMAIVGERVYLAVLPPSASDDEQVQAPELRAYDIETGALVETWTDTIPAIQTAISDFVLVHLFASPDETRLFIALEEFGSGPTIVSSRTLASYSLPDMTYESASIQSDSTASRQFPSDFAFYDSYVTPDGSFIYRVNVEDETVQFRSSDASEDLDLPLPFVQERGLNEDLQWITSNDGRYLYILSVQRAEVAMVDLLARRVARSFPLDFAPALETERADFRQQRTLGTGFGTGLGLSLDGRFLYFIGNSDSEAGTRNAEQTGLWTIDLATWTVTGKQELPGLALNLSSLDGRLIVLSELVSGNATNVRSLSVIDPVTGAVLSTYEGAGLPEWTGGFFSYALHEYYRFIYGRAPAVDGVAYEDVAIESTLPRISVVASGETIPAGKSFELAVRALNPVDGQLLAEDAPEVRFAPDSTVIVRLIHAEGAGDAEILVTNQAEPGRFVGTSTLLETGYWNAEVTFTGVDGDTWTYTAREVFQIVPSWEASDGKRYILSVSADADEVVVDETVTVTARFVDIDDGEPLPEDTEIRADFPDEIQVNFASEGQGTANATLELNEEGVYEGPETFWTDGEWQVTVTFRLANGDAVAVEAGTITVGE